MMSKYMACKTNAPPPPPPALSFQIHASLTKHLGCFGKGQIPIKQRLIDDVLIAAIYIIDTGNWTNAQTSLEIS